MERLQFPTTFEKRWASQRFEIDQIIEMWDPSGGGCQPRLFLQQEGVEKLGSGGTRCYCALGWFRPLELGPFLGRAEHGNQQAFGVRLPQVHCLSARFLHSFICQTPGLLSVSPTSSSHLRRSYLYRAPKEVRQWALQSSPLRCVDTCGPRMYSVFKITSLSSRRR
jgi:hypothetical protein